MEEKKYYKKEISIIDKEWVDKYVNPQLGFPKGKAFLYKSFYVKIGDSIKRFGIYDIEHNNHRYYGSVKLYSKSRGEFELNDIYLQPCYVYIDNIDKKAKILKYDKVYNENELENIYVFYKSKDNQYLMKCCVNGETKKELPLADYGEAAFYYCDVHPDNILYYRQENNGMYYMFQYNILLNEEKYIGITNINEFHSLAPCNTVRTHRYLSPLGNSKETFYDDKYVYFYFSYVNSKPFLVLFDYIQNADKIEIIKNIIDTDSTINYRVTYSRNRIKDIEFVWSIIFYDRIPGTAILNYPLINIVSKLTYGNIVEETIFKMRDRSYEEYLEIINELKKKLGVDTDKDLLEKLVVKYSKGLVYHEWPPSNYTYPFFACKDRKEYELIYSKLINENAISVKWKGESEMYNLIKLYFPKAIFQYHCDWLNLQSLDVFVPEINIAFEYQGEQHYHSVEVFGGEVKYEEQQERDSKKRLLCKKNGVKLIEWKYDEKISFHNLKSKLKKYDIDIELADNNGRKKEKDLIFDNYEVIEYINSIARSINLVSKDYN